MKINRNHLSTFFLLTVLLFASTAKAERYEVSQFVPNLPGDIVFCTTEGPLSIMVLHKDNTVRVIELSNYVYRSVESCVEHFDGIYVKSGNIYDFSFGSSSVRSTRAVSPNEDSINYPIGGEVMKYHRLKGRHYFNAKIIDRSTRQIMPSFSGREPIYSKNTSPQKIRYQNKDFSGKSARELDLMRNELFARAGLKFKRPDLLKYFSQFSWYKPNTSDPDLALSRLSKSQQEKAKSILEYQKVHGLLVKKK